ncbi:transmembrane domain-containing protein [Cryptosporidium canis]|uniref:Transmembrane domain-containing protein n=1 Tax=Cryptosporidium canis TaxID=195482 RepID=A0ABQ8P394_9CRYT|nr:transmembrane domain-containing protein [Cryptosporidium canis]KAJ1612829.1 transmembrane domain-containing protein [Cryptosporidium canis]
MVHADSRGVLEGVELSEGHLGGEKSTGKVHSGLGSDFSLSDEGKSVLNARRGIARMIADIALGGESGKQYKQGSAAYLIHKIQRILRLISLVFSILILVFIITSRVNRGKKSVFSSFPGGSLGRSVKFDMMLDNLENGSSELREDSMTSSRAGAGGGVGEKEDGEHEGLEDFNSEILDDPEYWADDNDRDLWEDDLDEYYDMDIVSSEKGESLEGDDSKDASAETSMTQTEGNTPAIVGKRNKGLRSKGVEVSLPSSLTLYGRVSKDDTYVNGVYNIVMDEKGDGKRYPKLHHGRAIYKKEKGVMRGAPYPELFVVFDGTHEFWTISSSLDPDSKPLAFLPDHGLIPIRHVGPYGAHSNSTWVFRRDGAILKDSSVRIVENSSIELPRVPVYITKATHNWHMKHHKEAKVSSSRKSGESGTKVYMDPYN